MAATKEITNRAEWEASIAEDTALFRSVVEKQDADSDRADDAPEEDLTPRDAPEESEDEPADEAQPEPDDETEGDDADGEADSEDPDDDELEVDDEPEADTAPASDDESEDDLGGPEPFTYKADGNDYAPEGAVRTRFKDEKGQLQEYVVMPLEAWQRGVQPNLRAQSAIQERELQLRRDLAARDPENNADVVFARKLAGELHNLITAGDEEWEEKLLSWADGYRESATKLREDADTESRTAQDRARTSVLSAEETQAQLKELETQFEQALTAEVDSLIQKHPGIDKDELLEDLVHDYGISLFFRADKDYPEFGLKAGEWGLDAGRVEKRVQREAARLERRRKVEETVSTVEERNRKRLGKTGPRTARPAAAANNAPSRSRKPDEFKNRAEWEESLDDEFNPYGNR